MTTTVQVLPTHGVLGPVWAAPGGQDRVAFDSMPGVARSAKLAVDSIGKPRWWERRPSGGEGA